MKTERLVTSRLKTIEADKEHETKTETKKKTETKRRSKSMRHIESLCQNSLIYPVGGIVLVKIGANIYFLSLCS